MNRLKETRIERDWNKMDTVMILQSIGLNLLFYKQNVIDKNVLFIVYKKYFYLCINSVVINNSIVSLFIASIVGKWSNTLVWNISAILTYIIFRK